jgi:hypothetical protein
MKVTISTFGAAAAFDSNTLPRQPFVWSPETGVGGCDAASWVVLVAGATEFSPRTIANHFSLC